MELRLSRAMSHQCDDNLSRQAMISTDPMLILGPNFCSEPPHDA